MLMLFVNKTSKSSLISQYKTLQHNVQLEKQHCTIRYQIEFDCFFFKYIPFVQLIRLPVNVTKSLTVRG